ncbi:AAA family ATPase [Denitrobaculum tricleocarpae]|uniref:AAA family ATPase n=1 Tax=Denitrobaculum tricleocarpae TaxID=2591009 RepID=A0A545TAQ2_9PROT|nr:bifunctional aminoglycoside phosphotransferase/ATP-binding protein [Denitrobaculum tricleocarpae]TQV74295.1 AAA family ATPase [Denitrobaculum tricleocarpae]
MSPQPDRGTADSSGRGVSRSSNPHQMEDQSEVEAFLASPAAHGLLEGDVERIDTHAAVVFLAGDRAYKIKRAVKYPYLDFSTLAKRRDACLHELELNLRTAPALYLGLAAVRRTAAGELTLEQEDGGETAALTLEYAVVMKRFNREDEFDRIAERGALDDQLLADLASVIAAFHETAVPHVTGFDHAAGFTEIVTGNDLAFEEYQGIFPRAESRALSGKALAAIAANAALFAARQKRGKVRQCHGDLHLANIVLIDGQPVLFDAIEFDDRIAIIDVLYDLAFLLMDLWQDGRKREANAVFNRYLSITDDTTALPLLPLFLSVRAAIRAKVAAASGKPGEAGDYFRQAVRFLEPGKRRCVAVGGLSGSGKTSLARALAPEIGSAPGAVHVRSDVIRKELFCMPETERLPQSAYSSAVTERVYSIMLERAHKVLSKGHSVIVDAVFSKPAEREAFETMAKGRSVAPQCFWLRAPEETLKARVAARHGDASDATPAVVDQQAGYDLGALSWRQVDSGAGLETVAQEVQAMINGADSVQ